MRFQKIEMVGFKSFVDKTTVTFQDGMTAVVGPNGCGKSNISDAIRWVLGEKSARNLRGEKMEDVIFNGSELRKPTGMAEVSLTLQNVDGAGTLGFTEFREITVTRRLYRSGESEYLINKIPCRLKDIRDLLIDAGVGSKAYSIIEQGKIGQLIVSKPEERRFIIEEVAGITKYKTRKNEALGKLRETEDNLNRVSDIVHEVKRQIGSLDRQAKKAERYKRLAAELRGLELKMAWDDYTGLLSKSAEADTEAERLHAGENAARNRVSAREADLSAARIRLAEREHELMEHQKEVHRVESEISRLEARAEVALTQLKGLDEREERMAADRGLLAAEESELNSQTSTLMGQQQALIKELDALRGELSVMEGAYQAKVDRAHVTESEVERERMRLFDLQAEISQDTNRLTRLEERIRGLEARAARAAEEEAETRDKISEQRLASQKKRMELDAVMESHAAFEAEHASDGASLLEIRELIKDMEQYLLKGRELYSQKGSRLQSLRELEDGLEGYGEGVKTLMAEVRRGALKGVHGIVADILQTSPEHERAVEAALGERLQNMVVEGHDDARAAIERLKAGNGRGTFMPLAPREVAEAAHPAGDGVVGTASALVRAKDGYGDVLKALLGRVLVVESLDDALRLWREGYAYTLVTLGGEVVEPTGAVSGGVSNGGGLLSKKREIRELTVEVERLLAENQALEERLAETKSKRDVLEASLAELGVAINEKKMAAVGLEKDLGAIVAELERVEKKAEVLGIESAQRAQEEQEIKAELDVVRGRLDALQAEKLKKETGLSGRLEELKAVKGEMELEREALTAKKVELSALIQRHESSARDIKRVDLHREELARKAARLDTEGKEVAARREELSAGKKEAEEGINVLMRDVLALKEAVPGLQSSYEEASSSITGLEEALRKARADADAARDSVSELELRRTELKIKVEHIVETVRHNYHMAITDVEEDIKATAVEREEAEMNAAELRIKLERLGPVNIGAIEEYNELMERYTFLTTQKEDLEASVARLKEAIGKINKTSEELFMEAFDAINEKFKTVFVSLFSGGRAELQLSPPENGDILESGLEIVAQPPGKKLQSLLLFSGGEKALIAAALTFACFLVKPSPFCVLDEVDAPLDESNVQRFGYMLKEFADKTQFIVITHSRPTMELADALYGVTMDEPGVSRMVSVKLKEAAEMAAA